MTAPSRAEFRRLRPVLCLDDFETAARRHLPRPLFAYVSGAAETDAALRDNRGVFGEIGLLPRALTDVRARTCETPLLGRLRALPFGIAPMGMCGLTGFESDLAMARAARRANIPYALSSASLVPMEEVAAANPDAWYQFYPSFPPERLHEMLDRIAAAGFGTLVVTVDTAMVPSRENNIRAGFRIPFAPSAGLLWQGLTHPRWTCGTFLRGLARRGPPRFVNAGPVAREGGALLARRPPKSYAGRDWMTWDTMREIRGRWPGPMILKGLLHPGDVTLAREAGMDGVILSNHGGRQLDHAVSPLRLLPLAKQLAGAMPVMIDSGFRRGTDILKAFALGADFAFIGRPFNYAAALAGEAGVDHAVGLLRTELMADLGMLGVTAPGEMSEGHLLLGGFRAVEG